MKIAPTRLPMMIATSAAQNGVLDPFGLLAELADEPMVLLDLPHSRDHSRRILTGAGVAPTVRYQSASVETCRTLVGRGLAYTVLNLQPKVPVSLDGHPVAAVPIRDDAPVGRRREKLAGANAIVDELLEAVASDLPFKQGDNVALMINGLGGAPVSELYLLYGYAHEQLGKRGINVRRNYVGNYCTSLDVAGASMTLSRLDDEISGLLAAPAEIAIRTF
jgi:hypothetical protein